MKMIRTFIKITITQAATVASAIRGEFDLD
jgi:FlaG/FlaF family flagellin (archaellin)